MTPVGQRNVVPDDGLVDSFVVGGAKELWAGQRSPGRGGEASPSPDAAAEVWSINASRQRWRDHIILHTSLHLNSEKGKATGLTHEDGKIIFSSFDLIHFFF